MAVGPGGPEEVGKNVYWPPPHINVCEKPSFLNDLFYWPKKSFDLPTGLIVFTKECLLALCAL